MGHLATFLPETLLDQLEDDEHNEEGDQGHQGHDHHLMLPVGLSELFPGSH